MKHDQAIDELEELEVTDCSLWRTLTESNRKSRSVHNSDPPITQEKSNVSVSDNSLWRTHVTNFDEQSHTSRLQTTGSTLLRTNERLSQLSVKRNKKRVKSNFKRRKTLNPLIQHIVPITPDRRATLLNPPKIDCRRASVFPYFDRSSQMEASDQLFDVSDTTVSSVLKTPDSFIISSPRHSTISRPCTRLANRVRLQEAIKIANETNKSMTTPSPLRSFSISSSEYSEDQSRIADKSKALLLISELYASPQPIDLSIEPQSKPRSLLNNEDFTTGSPQESTSKPIGYSIPNDSRFNANLTNFDQTIRVSMGQSFALGGSDVDSDLASSSPKHFILRNLKQSPYLYAVKPKIVVGSDENRNQHPEIRRSNRVRLSRTCNRGIGERPIYVRDLDGNFSLVKVQEGRTADPLCKKWKTFDKQKAIELDRESKKRRRAAKEVNKQKWQLEFHVQ
ncbi:hypothetical protein M3Y98_00739900 [Aphelenchoides besseyi]|nr:hypothetical protein M3Y98_00739900 [Aphelenchoides besseyi]KAI6211446.1 hypothetical protein M3Y96_00435100 [Aphelenchoides besseyi]